MTLTKYVLVVVMAAVSMICLSSDSRAHHTYDTLGLWVTSPQDGDRFGTHDLIRVRFNADICGDIPPQGIQYLVVLNGAVIGTGNYDSYFPNGICSGGRSLFVAFGSYDWRVPGNGSSRNPGSELTVYSSSDTGDYDVWDTVIIGVKTWYDPLPFPQETSPAKDENTGRTTTTWGKVKALYQ